MKHRATLATLCLLLLAGCAGTPLRPDTSGLEAEIQRLRAQVVELQRQAAMDEVEIARLRQQAGETVGRPAATPRPSTTTQAPRPAGVQASTTPPRPAPPRIETRQPVATPPRTTPTTPKIEPAPTRPAPVEEIEEADIDVPDTPPIRSQTRPATPPPTAPPVVAPPVVKPAPAPATPPAADAGTEEVLSPASQALYDRGYTLYHQGHFVDAETSFQRFLQGNPKSELADNAQYWIGECRYARGDLRGALAAFRETVSRFPEGNKVPDALLKSGQCLEALDDVEGARAVYADVIRRFPGTAAAEVADERRLSLR